MYCKCVSVRLQEAYTQVIAYKNRTRAFSCTLGKGGSSMARVEVGKHNVVNDIMAKGHRLRKRRMVQKEMYLNTFKKITMERTD